MSQDASGSYVVSNSFHLIACHFNCPLEAPFVNRPSLYVAESLIVSCIAFSAVGSRVKFNRYISNLLLRCKKMIRHDAFMAQHR